MQSKYNYISLGIFTLLFILYILYLLYKQPKLKRCLDCNVWNHIDAISKCKRICKEDNKTFSGKWSRNKTNPKESLCECE